MGPPDIVVVIINALGALLGLGAFIRPAPPMTEDQAEEMP